MHKIRTHHRCCLQESDEDRIMVIIIITIVTFVVCLMLAGLMFFQYLKASERLCVFACVDLG